MSDLYEFKGAAGAGYAQPSHLLEEQRHRAMSPKGRGGKARVHRPKASGPKLVHDYAGLSARNVGIDAGFYQLG